jgi:hypothetical protein
VTYFMYIETGCAFDAESEESAKEQAITWYIEQLQRGEIELLVEEEC